MAVNAVRNELKTVPPLPELVEVKVTTTDPVQRASVENSRVRVSGVAAGLGGHPSELTLAFEGAHLLVTLKAGTSARDAAKLLERVMPNGYRFSVAEANEDEIVGEVVRRPKLQPVRAVSPSLAEAARSAEVAGPQFADASAG